MHNLSSTSGRRTIQTISIFKCREWSSREYGEKNCMAINVHCMLLPVLLCPMRSARTQQSCTCVLYATQSDAINTLKFITNILSSLQMFYR